MTVPTWYNDNHYISEKVDECNTIKFGAVEGEEFTPWTAQTVRDFMAGAYGEESYAPWMGYDNFVTNGNAENVSPNPLFDVMQYVYAKAAQLNALNDGAGYGVNANNWTGQLVLDFFKANNISAWDHFTTAGQFERVNPSNAMDINAFLAAKAAQCNDLQFDDKSDWTPETVLDYYRANGLNAVEVANSANDPLVTPVPAENAVTVPTNLNPWGTQGPLNVVELTTGADEYSDEGVPTNFTGIVDGSASKATFNNGDQITGTNDADVLTVTMNADFRGMDKGFVKGVPTIDLVDAAGKDVTFNASGIEDAETFNLTGNINLTGLTETADGLNVNLANVNTQKGVNLQFDAATVAGTDDAITIGLDNVFIPGRVASTQGGNDQPAQPVGLSANGIEHVTVNSEGTTENVVDLGGIKFMQDLTIAGDANLRAYAYNTDLSSIDAQAASGNLRLSHAGATLADATLGSGNDRINTQNLGQNATIDGGAGNDTLNAINASGEYVLNMSNVETLRVTDNSNFVTVQGNNIEGMENLVVSGIRQDVTLDNFTQSSMNVQAINANDARLVIDDQTDINLRVGDGSKNTEDSFTGQLTLGSATDLTINADDGVNADSLNSTFDAVVFGDQVQNLTLQAAKSSHVTIAAGENSQGDGIVSNLSSLSSVTATGNGIFVLGGDGALIGTQANDVTVNSSAMSNGSFTGIFTNNAVAGTLNVTGGNVASTNITVDSSYSAINVTSGQAADTLVLDCGDGTAWNADGQHQLNNIDLGTGNNNTLIVKGVPFVENEDGTLTWSDLSGLKGISNVVFTDSRATEYNFADNLKLADGVNITYGDNTLTWPGTTGNDAFVIDVPNDINHNAIFTYGGQGGADTFTGIVNNTGDSVVIQAEENPGDPAQANGSVSVNFKAGLPSPATLAQAATDGAVYVNGVNDLTVAGGALNSNSITGTVANVEGVFTATTAQGGESRFALNSINAKGGVEIDAQSKGAVRVGTLGNNAETVTASTNAITTEGTFQMTAGNAVGLVDLGAIVADKVLVGAEEGEGEDAAPVTDGNALVNVGNLNIGNISNAVDGVVINTENQGGVTIGTINASETVGATTTLGNVDIDIVNTASGIGGVQIGKIAQAANIDIDSVHTGAFAVGDLTAGQVAANGDVTAGDITVAINAGGAATVGAVQSNGGDVEISTTGANGTTFNVGAINAGAGDVTISTTNTGATTIAGITTTEKATVNVGANAGATTLTTGNIGMLDYNGNAAEDYIGGYNATTTTFASTVTVGAGSNIATGAGDDAIGIVATGNGTIDVNPGEGSDTVSATVSNNAGERTFLNFDLGAGQDNIWLANTGLNGTSIITIDLNNDASDKIHPGTTGVGNAWKNLSTDGQVAPLLAKYLGTAPDDLVVSGISSPIAGGGSISGYAMVKCESSNLAWDGYWLASQEMPTDPNSAPTQGFDLVHVTGVPAGANMATIIL